MTSGFNYYIGSFNRYQSRKKRNKLIFKNAQKIGSKELNESIKSFLDHPGPKSMGLLLKTMATNGAWISNSLIRYLHSMVDFETNRFNYLKEKKSQEILLKIAKNEPITEELSAETLFNLIFQERVYAHYHPHEKSLLTIPKINGTIVLIDGVFNELFSTGAFERALKNLHRLYGIQYFIPQVKGTKGTKYNVSIIKSQLEGYIEKKPDEKLWILGFSKGGVDTLHFLADNPCFGEKYILGLSTIAAPILGTEHFNHKLIRPFTKIQNKLAALIRKDILFKELMQYLKSEIQGPWFDKHYKILPKNIFYTALSFESKWFEGHLWMMIAKAFLQNKEKNDGVVEVIKAHFPFYFQNGINLGTIKAHHLVGTRSSSFCQEALIEAHLIFAYYKNLIN